MNITSTLVILCITQVCGVNSLKCTLRRCNQCATVFTEQMGTLQQQHFCGDYIETPCCRIMKSFSVRRLFQMLSIKLKKKILRDMIQRRILENSSKNVSETSVFLVMSRADLEIEITIFGSSGIPISGKLIHANFMSTSRSDS